MRIPPLVRAWLFAGLLFTPAPTLALSPLVTGGWVKDNLDNPQVVFLDIQDIEDFQRYHIPGSVNAPYQGWRTGPNTPIPELLRPLAELESMLGKIGIRNDHTLIIVSTGRGAGDLAAAARVYWTLTLMGHRELAILDGGLVSYLSNYDGSVAVGPVRNEAQTYQARPTLGALASLDDVRNSLGSTSQLLDARSRGEYLGIYRGETKERAGTLPGARNLPFHWLIEADTGMLRTPVGLHSLFEYAGMESRDGSIHFCHTGNRAALNWFVDYAILGHRKSRLYDGSMSEWARREGLPMEVKVKL